MIKNIIKYLILAVLFALCSFAQEHKTTGGVINIGNGKEFSGIYIYAPAGAALHYGELVYLKSDGKFYKVNISNTGHFSSKLAIVANDTLGTDSSGIFILEGFVTDTSWDYTGGAYVYADNIEGGISAEFSTRDDSLTQIVGFAIDSTTVYLDPNNDKYRYYWDDLRFSVSNTRLPGTAAPIPTLYQGSEVLAFPTNQDAIAYFLIQMPHSWIEGTDIEIHYHYALSQNGSLNDSISTAITYSWSDINEAIPAPTKVEVINNVSSLSDSTHYLKELLHLTGTGKTLSSIILCSFMRNVSNDNYAGNLYLLYIDVHYLTDGKGSRLELTK